MSAEPSAGHALSSSQLPPPRAGAGSRFAAVGVERPLVARRPVFTRDLEVAAYELFTAFPVTPISEERLAGLVISAVADVGLPTLVGVKPALIPASRQFIERDFARLLPSDRVTLAVADGLVADPGLAERLAGLATSGYRLLIEDASTEEATRLADIVSYDASSSNPEHVAERTRSGRTSPQLLVRNVADHEQVDRFGKAGFTLFSGSFLARPRPFAGGRAGEHRISRIRLIAALQDPACDLQTLDEVIESDAALSYRLLRFVNSAYFSLPRHVESVRDAVVLLGLSNVRVWASLLAIANSVEGPPELLRSSLIRARMAQMLSRTLGTASPEAAFTVGLFSNLGVLLGVDLESALADLPLTHEVKEALLGKDGPLGELLTLVTRYESARFGEVPQVMAMVMGGIYVDAIRYADGVMGSGLDTEPDSEAA
jgi:c-di-GMP phosphodiesterase